MYPEVVQRLPPHPVHGGGQLLRARAGRGAVAARVRADLGQREGAAGADEEDRGGPYRLLGARLDAEPVPVHDRRRFGAAVEQVERVEVAVHPARRGGRGGGRAAVGVAFDEAALGQLVERVARAPVAGQGEQVVDEGEGLGGICGDRRAGRRPHPRRGRRRGPGRHVRGGRRGGLGRGRVLPGAGRGSARMTRARQTWTTPSSEPSRRLCGPVRSPPSRWVPSTHGCRA